MERPQFEAAPQGIRLIRLESCDSTNTYLRDNLPGLMERFPVAVSALSQSKGRGREDRSWFSIPGKGVYLSLGFILARSRDLNLLSLIAGLTISETLQRITGKGFNLKWPNDVYHEKKKIAGSLIENIVSADRIISICGMGINLNHRTADFPQELKEIATSAKAITGEEVSPVDFEHCLINNFFKWLGTLEEGKSSAIINRFRELHLIRTGDEIRFTQNRGIIKGRYLGINEGGGIEIQLSNGVREIFFSGEIDSRD